MIHGKWLPSDRTIEEKEPPECSAILKQMEPDKNGFYQIDDMMLTKDQLKLLFNPPSFQMQAVAYFGYRWPDGDIPYEFSADVPEDKRKIIREQIQDMNNKLSGCVRIQYFVLSYL